MKKIMTLALATFVLSISLIAMAKADSFPITGEYVVRGASAIGIRCRKFSSYDSLGQTKTTMSAVSDANGVLIYDAEGRLMESLLITDGYKYSDHNQVIAKGRARLIMDGSALILDGGPRLPTDIGFGPITCKFPVK